MSDDPETLRVSELLARLGRGELSEAEAEELELYAQEDPELRPVIEARRRHATLGGAWLARAEADHHVAQVERSAGVVLTRGLAFGLVVAGMLAAIGAPLLGGGMALAGLAVLVYSWIRINHRHDPYKDIQR